MTNAARDIVVIGAGGHGKDVVQLIRDINRERLVWNLVGYIDDNAELRGKVVGGTPIIGSIETLDDWKVKRISVVCAVGCSKMRRQMQEALTSRYPWLHYPTLVHPTVVMGDRVMLGEGTIVGALSILSADVMIGKHSLIHNGCTVGHDSVLGNYVSIMPGTNVSGNVTISPVAYIGANATLLPGIGIGEYSTIGAGAVVTASMPAYCTAVGVPAKPIKFHDPVLCCD
ncbi:MAG: epsM 2 [Paenibacillus sp.]|jgi:sugar O-acyltransferase (sialic acid O-acetyltransferase NeuD family)|nr:epsM 2 [Paenibacillus sp.]